MQVLVMFPLASSDQASLLGIPLKEPLADLHCRCRGKLAKPEPSLVLECRGQPRLTWEEE